MDLKCRSSQPGTRLWTGANGDNRGEPRRGKPNSPARRTRVGVAIPLIILFAAGCGGSSSKPSEGASSLEETVVGSPSELEPTFRVVAVVVTQEPVGTLRSAASQHNYETLWTSVGGEGAPPAVRLESEIVVSMAIPDDACPPELVALDVDGTTLTPRFREVVDACDDPMLPKSYVVAIERSSVQPGFYLQLPEGLVAFDPESDQTPRAIYVETSA